MRRQSTKFVNGFAVPQIVLPVDDELVQSKSYKKSTVLIEDLSGGMERFAVPVVVDGGHSADVDVFRYFKYASRIVDSYGIIAYQNTLDAVVACSCKAGCLESGCDCSLRVYGKDRRVRDVELLTQMTVSECSSLCSCALWCGNRVAQKGPCHPVEVFPRDDGCGWAVRAAVDIHEGSFVGEYTGELIDDDEASARNENTFLFETQLGEETYTIDAKFYGNYTRFVNHCCEPNVKVANVVWDACDQQLVHMCLFTIRDICVGEEITIDYGDSWWNSKVQQLLAYGIYKGFLQMFPCLCNSLNCRFGRIRGQRCDQ